MKNTKPSQMLHAAISAPILMVFLLGTGVTFKMASAGDRDTSYLHSFEHIKNPEKVDILNENIEGISKNSTKEEILNTMKEKSYTNISTPPSFDSNAGTINLEFEREDDGKRSKITYNQSKTDDGVHSYTKIEYENYTHTTDTSDISDEPKESVIAYHTPSWDQSHHADEIKAIIERYCHPETQDISIACTLETDRVDISFSEVMKLEKATKHVTFKIDASYKGVSKTLTISES